MSRPSLKFTPHWHAKLTRALERRFGKSVLPYDFKHVADVPAYGNVWRVTDVETGSWVEAVCYCGRLQVRRWHDGAAAEAA